MKRATLIIDTDSLFASSTKRMIEHDWEGMRVDILNPDEWGWPQDIDWKHYSIVMLASELGEDDGLEWLEVLQFQENFPACVIMGNSGAADDLDIRAKDIGATDYIRKSLISRVAIRDSIKTCIRTLKVRHLAAKTSELDFLEQELSLSPNNADKSHNTSAIDITSSSNVLTDTNTDDKDEKTSASESKVESAAIQLNKKIRVDGYEIQSKIAEGGMSGIYLCKREEDGKPAVLKTILTRAKNVKKLKAIERSDLEYNVISRINHPNIVKLYDHGRVGDFVYTTMEYFDTGDLKQRMEKGITQQQALSYMVQIADGLNAIHGSGIIHRDLKPANIMFRQDETLAILDFGIAKDITNKDNLTLPGMRLGTPSYMSPEQGNGGYKLDARSDLYSLGVMLYEMLTKKRPFRGRAADVIKAHMYDPIPQLPGEYFEVQTILDKLMGKFPHDRFESAYDLTQFIRSNYRYDTTLNFDFDPDGDFLALDRDKNALF